MTENLYCPKWIFDVCTASCAESFINDTPLDISCKKFTRGLKCILEGFKNNQNEISKFINRCKNFEDENGYLKQDFFNRDNFVKGKFISGPFTNLVFDILSREADKIEILIGSYKTTLTKNSDFLYRPI